MDFVFPFIKASSISDKGTPFLGLSLCVGSFLVPKTHSMKCLLCDLIFIPDAVVNPISSFYILLFYYE